MAKLVRCAIVDLRTKRLQVAMLRLLRGCRVLLAWGKSRRLLANALYRSHVARVDGADLFAFLAHRNYLIRGLRPTQRIAAALHHYEHDARVLTPAAAHAIYSGAGLVLWQQSVDGVDYAIRWHAAQDVVHEGGSSLVLWVGGRRVCVVSFSLVPTSLLGAGSRAAGHAATAVTLFVARKQLDHDHSYQPAFHRAFDRVTAAHMVLAALEGLATAHGLDHFVGIAATAHIGWEPAAEPHFTRAYDEFWLALGGRRTGPLGFAVGVPMHLKPLDDLEAKARKRAALRRGHLTVVRQSAATAATAARMRPVAADAVSA